MGIKKKDLLFLLEESTHRIAYLEKELGIINKTIRCLHEVQHVANKKIDAMVSFAEGKRSVGRPKGVRNGK